MKKFLLLLWPPKIMQIFDILETESENLDFVEAIYFPKFKLFIQTSCILLSSICTPVALASDWVSSNPKEASTKTEGLHCLHPVQIWVSSFSSGFYSL